MLTQDRLKERLVYDPETGVFLWWTGPRPRGSRAGYIVGKKNKPYRAIEIDGKRYLEHRLAFLYMTGEWPENLVDHRDGNGLHNEWENLRPANYSENARNRRSTSQWGKGVRPSYTPGKFTSAIRVDGRIRHLGTFTDPVAANLAYARAAEEHFGEFARTS